MSPLDPNRSFKYDVAFSLLARDAGLAESLAERLAPLRTFVFTAEQRELVGRNGVEAFSKLFRRDARLAVVLHREGYGKTEFTDLEVRGIQDRALETQWVSPLLFKLDDSDPPSWYPNRNIWLDLQRYPLDEAVGAIRLRTEELGAITRAETPTELLTRLSQKKSSDDQRHRFQESEAGFDAVDAEVKAAVASLRRSRDEAVVPLQHTGTEAIDVNLGIALVSRFGSVLMEWSQQYHRSIDGAGLYIKFFDGYISVAGSRAGREGALLSDTGYKPKYDADFVWRWYPDDDGRALTTSELQDAILKRWFSEIFSRSPRARG
ncbi:MAG: hypothetical protein ACR2OU_17955 [Thermomicrobiales bacterium]